MTLKFNKAKKSVRPNEIRTIKNVEEYFAEAKIDGARYRIIRENGVTKIISKRISVQTGDYVDKTDNFPQFLFKGTDMFDFDIEVEMVIGNGSNCSSKLVTAISGSLPERAVQLQEENGYLNGVIIDVHNINGKGCDRETVLDKRVITKMFIVDAEHYLTKGKFLQPRCHAGELDPQLLEVIYQDFIDAGFEGVMLKHKRTSEWIKIKKLDTWDYIIAGFQETDSEDFKSRGMWVGSIVLGYINKDEYEEFHKLASENLSLKFLNDIAVYLQGTVYIVDRKEGKAYPVTECGTCSGFDHSIRTDFSNKPHNYIGRVIKVSGQELDKKLGVRHPRFEEFHEDKSALEVTAEDLKRNIKEKE